MISSFLEHYPDQPTIGQPQGSPFRSDGSFNVFSQYKRIAAVSGDILCTLWRRRILEYLSPVVPSWSYLSSFLHNTTDLGSFHGAEMPYVYGTAADNPDLSTAFQTYFISFISHLDPNALGLRASMIHWPQYLSGSSPQLLNLYNSSNEIILDDFREDAYQFLKAHESGFRL